MRKVVAASAFVAVAVSASMVACNRSADGPSVSTSADVERDLHLAGAVQSPRTAVVSPIEQTSNSGPSGNQAGKRVAVPTKKRAPAPAPSPTLAEVAIAPPDVSPVSAQTTAAAAATEEVASIGTGAAPVAAPVFMVTDPIRSMTVSEVAVGGIGQADDAGASGYNPHRPGLRVMRAVWERFSVRPGAIIRGASTGMDHCEPPRIGGGGILGATFGGSGNRRTPVGSTEGGVGAPTPNFLPAGIGPSHGGTSAAAGANNHSPAKW